MSWIACLAGCGQNPAVQTQAGIGAAAGAAGEAAAISQTGPAGGKAAGLVPC
jgi:hypothetical protein